MFPKKFWPLCYKEFVLSGIMLIRCQKKYSYIILIKCNNRMQIPKFVNPYLYSYFHLMRIGHKKCRYWSWPIKSPREEDG